jgi:hypothetical protein
MEKTPGRGAPAAADLPPNRKKCTLILTGNRVSWLECEGAPLKEGRSPGAPARRSLGHPSPGEMNPRGPIVGVSGLQFLERQRLLARYSHEFMGRFGLRVPEARPEGSRVWSEAERPDLGTRRTRPGRGGRSASHGLQPSEWLLAPLQGADLFWIGFRRFRSSLTSPPATFSPCLQHSRPPMIPLKLAPFHPGP